MRRTSFAGMTCSIARTLESVGDWWTLLIVREAFYGSRRFGEFHDHLGIAPNILAQRLSKLVEDGLFEVTSESENGRALEYRLTPAGRDLFPVLVAFAQWGDRHATAPNGPPVRIVEKKSQREIAPMTLRSAAGRRLDASDVMFVEGPGADPADRQRFARAASQRAAPDLRLGRRG